MFSGETGAGNAPDVTMGTVGNGTAAHKISIKYTSLNNELLQVQISSNTWGG